MDDLTKEDHVSNGIDLFVEGKLHEAIAVYEKALEIDAAYAEAHLGIAKAYEHMGSLDQALEVLRRAAEANPSEPFIHTSLSQCLQKQGLIPEAEEEMAIAFRLQAGEN